MTTEETPGRVRWLGIRLQHPLDIPSILIALARLMMAVALVMALFVLRNRIDDADAERRCRDRIESMLTTAKVARDIADDQATIAIGVEVGIELPPAEELAQRAGLPVEEVTQPRSLEEALADLYVAEVHLEQVRDLQITFEETHSCDHVP